MLFTCAHIPAVFGPNVHDTFAGSPIYTFLCAVHIMSPILINLTPEPNIIQNVCTRLHHQHISKYMLFDSPPFAYVLPSAVFKKALHEQYIIMYYCIASLICLYCMYRYFVHFFCLPAVE